MKITYVTNAACRIEVEAREGVSAMEVAVANNVPGIEAECGGACSCATCHVYVDPEWQGLVGAAEGIEADMLEMAYEVNASSRLSCQIKLTDRLDGLVLLVPDRQI